MDVEYLNLPASILRQQDAFIARISSIRLENTFTNNSQEEHTLVSPEKWAIHKDENC